MAGRVGDGLVDFHGPCWRAVSANSAAAALDGTTRAGRYNRPGERTLYMSGSPVGVAAAMARYGDGPRTLVKLDVNATKLVDLRDTAACRLLGIDVVQTKKDWIAALAHDREPPSWAASDRARLIGASGLIDPSRTAPGEWHLVLFAWNAHDLPTVRRA